MDKKKFHYVIVGNFETDGDYCIDVRNYHENFREYIEYGDHNYIVNFETDDVFDVRDFLEDMMVSFNVGSGHHWILPELYNLVNKVHNALLNEEVDGAYETYGGNYTGTELILRKIENYDQDVAEKPLAAIDNGKLLYFCCPRCKSEVNLKVSCCVSCGKKLNWEILKELQPCSIYNLR